MLASLLIRPGQLELCEVETPSPGPGEVVVKIRAALTCGTDLKAYLRGHPKIPMPTLFGHEFSGEIAQVGQGVKTFREGDQIMSVHSAPCGTCYYCSRGQDNLCEMTMAPFGEIRSTNIETRNDSEGFGFLLEDFGFPRYSVMGAYAEYIRVPSHIVKQNMYAKPSNLSFKEAALLEPLACVLHGFDQFTLGRDDTVVVIGAGAIGLMHLLILRTLGVDRVILVGRRAYRLKLARELGAAHVVDADTLFEGNSKFSRRNPKQIPKRPKTKDQRPKTKDFFFAPGLESWVLSLGSFSPGDIRASNFLPAGGADVVIECTGKPEVWESAIQMVRRGGQVVLFGGCPSGTKVSIDTGRLHYDQITLRSPFHYTRAAVRRSYDVLTEGLSTAKQLITAEYPLEQLPKVFSLLRRGDCVKYAVIPELVIGYWLLVIGKKTNNK